MSHQSFPVLQVRPGTPALRPRWAAAKASASLREFSGSPNRGEFVQIQWGSSTQRTKKTQAGLLVVGAHLFYESMID